VITLTRFSINAGKYRHVITIQQLLTTENTYGETIRNDDTNWEDVLTTRAGIFPISGKDYFNEDVINAEITHKIQMRYQTGIDSSMRIKFGNRIFDIISPPIDFQERHREIQLMCKERNVLPTER
jgi:SPP1 family predicted phage head-tail adaptor